MPLSGDRALRSFVAGPCAARQRAAWGMGAFVGGRNLGIRVNTRSPGARGQSPDRCPDRAGGPLRPRLAVAGGRRTPGSGLSNETGRGTFWWPRPLLVTTPWPTRWQCNVRLFHFPPQGLQNREYARSRELNLPARHERRLSGGPSGGPSEPCRSRVVVILRALSDLAEYPAPARPECSLSRLWRLRGCPSPGGAGPDRRLPVAEIRDRACRCAVPSPERAG